MKLINILLAIWLGLMIYHTPVSADTSAVNCNVTSISESVIQKLKKRISPF